MIKRVFSLFFLFLCLFAKAQEGPPMADALRDNGKIYVVIGVIAIIFVSIVALLIILERKIKKLEEKMKS
jgi:hypothetical protein